MSFNPERRRFSGRSFRELNREELAALSPEDYARNLAPACKGCPRERICPNQNIRPEGPARPPLPSNLCSEVKVGNMELRVAHTLMLAKTFQAALERGQED